VGDHQDRLARLADRPLELELGRDVEEVVGLVEQQHVGVGAQQHVEHELLALPARERHRRPVSQRVEPGPGDPPARHIPLRLELIAAQRRPVRDRLAQRDPRHRDIATRGGELILGRRDRTSGASQLLGRERQQQLAHRLPAAVDADVLGHRQQPAAVRGLALGGLQLAGNDPQQRRLADAVDPDQARVRAGRELERDLGEQLVAARMRIAQIGHGHVCHQPMIPSASWVTLSPRWRTRRSAPNSSRSDTATAARRAGSVADRQFG